MEADGAVDAQNAPTVPWKTLCVFHELPQGLSNQITHEKPRKAPKWRWETRIDPFFQLTDAWPSPGPRDTTHGGARRTAPLPVCRKRPRPCEKSKSWVADPAASRLEHGGGLATATPISRGVSRVGRVRDCCDRLTARFGLIVALEAGEIGVQPAAAAIIVGSPARLIARRML